MVEIVCAFCQNSEAKILYEVKDYMFIPCRLFKVVKCTLCGLIFTYPRLTSEELIKYYPSEFFEGQVDKVVQKITIFPKRDKVKIIKAFKKNGKILDIGCSNGGFLELMKEHGWDAYGTDISSIACKHAKSKLGNEHIFEGDILSLKLNKNFFDVITMWHVVEHTIDPLNELIKINSLLVPEGILVINCPNFDSWQRKIFHGCWYPLDIPRHLFHFTLGTLSKIVIKAGFRIKNIKYINDMVYDMSTLKISIMRLLGFGKMTVIGSSHGEERLKDKSFLKILWKLSRFCFNSFCFLVSFIMHIFGNREQILLICQKEEKNAGN